MKVFCFTLMMVISLTSGAVAAGDEKIPMLVRKAQPQTKQRELTADDKALLAGSVQRCWNPPAGVAGNVSIFFRLDRSGAVSGTPQTVRDMAKDREDAALEAAAKRAVLKCQPYTLPAENYNSWSEVIVNFATD
jgi:hypothetical protein